MLELGCFVLLLLSLDWMSSDQCHCISACRAQFNEAMEKLQMVLDLGRSSLGVRGKFWSLALYDGLIF